MPARIHSSHSLYSSPAITFAALLLCIMTAGFAMQSASSAPSLYNHHIRLGTQEEKDEGEEREPLVRFRPLLSFSSSYRGPVPAPTSYPPPALLSAHHGEDDGDDDLTTEHPFVFKGRLFTHTQAGDYSSDDYFSDDLDDPSASSAVHDDEDDETAEGNDGMEQGGENDGPWSVRVTGGRRGGTDDKRTPAQKRHDWLVQRNMALLRLHLYKRRVRNWQHHTNNNKAHRSLLPSAHEPTPVPVKG